VIAVAQLLTSELVSNAVEHASGSIRVSFDCTGGVLRVRVRDESAHLPTISRALDSDLRGRGLMLVAGLALGWGVAPDLVTGGKTVWFRLRTT
jgi:anti-sigma regulatory factor (Ser/Thr protein kinase)